MNLAHFYHVYAAGHWRQPVEEHLNAIRTSGLGCPITFGLVGSEDDRRRVITCLEQGLPRFGAYAAFGVDYGYEQMTLDVVLEHAAVHDGAVLYAHTKGAGTLADQQTPWRWYMTQALIGGWRQALSLLESGEYDAVGPHWISQQAFPQRRVPKPCFAGNFWMATCEYLRTLDPCSRNSRWEAEIWIGLNHPRVHDLLPGWPPHQP